MNYLHRGRLLISLFIISLSAVFLSSGISHSQLIYSHNHENTPELRGKLNQELALKSLTGNVNKTVLKNGLTVITKEVHTAPVVSVQVWYKIGSRDEDPGENGIAHQLEHMMFQGTKDRPVQFGRLFSALGGQFNAFTSYDQTAYHAKLERDKLSAVLTLEADRMKNSLINPEKLEKEKKVVISELQGAENSPFYRLDREVMKVVFPNHPYGLTVGGTKEDVEKFTLEKVKYYYDHNYNPNNAVLIVVGDFETKVIMKKIQEEFGKIPPENRKETSREKLKIGPAYSPETIGTKAPIILRQPGKVPILEAVYPLPDINHPDVPALNVMDYILSSGRSSRLYQAIVESGLGTEISAIMTNLSAGGWYTIYGSPANNSLTELDTALQKVITELQNKGVTEEELNRVKAQIRAQEILGNRDISDQALALGENETTAGDYRYTEKYLLGVDQVTIADVQRVAKTYLQLEKRVVGFFEPTEIDSVVDSTRSNLNRTQESFVSGKGVDPSPLGKYLPPITLTTNSIPKILREEYRLNNGLQILLLPDHNISGVSIIGNIKAGKDREVETESGVASLTANNLMNGTTSQDANMIAKTLENRGINLDFAVEREGIDLMGSSLTEDFSILLNTLADVLQNANFPEDQLQLTLVKSMNDLKSSLDDPGYVAIRNLQETIYPKNHPFHSFVKMETLAKIKREDLQDFYRKYYNPSTTVLTIIGDFDAEQVKNQINQLFGKWSDHNNSNYHRVIPSVSLPDKVVKLKKKMAGKAEAITVMGYPGITRKDQRFYAALILNEILGGGILSSRLETEIRDHQGLTYGINSNFSAGIYAGPFSISMQTAPENTDKAIGITLDILQQMRDRGVTQIELDTAKRSLISNYWVNLANPEVMGNVVLSNYLYGLNQDELYQITDKIQALTLEEVNQTAKELLHPDRLVIVTAGPG